jgi:hypothetical protein
MKNPVKYFFRWVQQFEFCSSCGAFGAKAGRSTRPHLIALWERGLCAQVDAGRAQASVERFWNEFPDIDFEAVALMQTGSGSAAGAWRLLRALRASLAGSSAAG